MSFPSNTLAHVDLLVDGDLMRRAFGPAFPKDARRVLSQGFTEASDLSEDAREKLLAEMLKPALRALMGMFEGQNLPGDFALYLVLGKAQQSEAA
jgi:hypothetical protein